MREARAQPISELSSNPSDKADGPPPPEPEGQAPTLELLAYGSFLWGLRGRVALCNTLLGGRKGTRWSVEVSTAAPGT